MPFRELYDILIIFQADRAPSKHVLLFFETCQYSPILREGHYLQSWYDQLPSIRPTSLEIRDSKFALRNTTETVGGGRRGLGAAKTSI